MANERPHFDDGVQIGEIGAPHGISGAVKVYLTTDFPERLGDIGRIWLDHLDGEGWSVKRFAEGPGPFGIMQLSLVATREQAQALRGCRVLVPKSSLAELPQDSFYWHQLLGLRVCDLDGRELGYVEHVHRQGGAHDFLEVSRPGDSSFLLPLVRAMVKDVDLSAKTLRVLLPEGLEDLN